jgi:8-oxo-dGTP pyrophosphatase MutT (NUDIX family)
MRADRFTEKLELSDAEAAVVLLTDKNGFVLIKRKARLNDPWSGQMALPGGFKKSGENIVETAERECFEEVGIKPDIGGSMGIYFTLNGQIKVQAFYALCEKTENFKINGEIEAAFWAVETELKLGENYYYYKDYKIWGLTYRILSDVFL